MQKKKDWEKKLDTKILDYVGRVIADYEKCLKRIQAKHNASTKVKLKHGDINRILYMQNKENDYSADELIAGLINLPAERVKKIFQALIENNWHFMKEDERYAFLLKYLPETELSEYYDCFADFRFGGYKLLTDVLTEIINYNKATNATLMYAVDDSEELIMMLDAYNNSNTGWDYREIVAEKAAKIIETHVISLNASVKYIVALGKRDFLYDAYYKHIYRFARKGEKNDD